MDGLDFPQAGWPGHSLCHELQGPRARSFWTPIEPLPTKGYKFAV
jgi:hypothetical protein